jgi:serine/threonine protein kinase
MCIIPCKVRWSWGAYYFLLTAPGAVPPGKELHCEEHDPRQVWVPTELAEIAIRVPKRTWNGWCRPRAWGVYLPFSSGHLPHLNRENLSEEARSYILQSVLHGLTNIHEKDVVHNGKCGRSRRMPSPWYWLSIDVRSNNILVDYEERAEGGVIIKNAQISDIEDTIVGLPGERLTSPLCSNAIWRSTESWCRPRQNQASDISSFGIVVWLAAFNINFGALDC